jgi:hypothetical protein
LRGIAGVGAVAVDEDEVRFHCESGAEGAAGALAGVVAAGIPVVRFGEVENSLEAAFVQIAREGVAA